MRLRVRNDTAYIGTHRGLYELDLLTGVVSDVVRKWGDADSPQACTGGSFAIFDLAILDEVLLVRNLATGALHRVDHDSVGDALERTQECTRIASLSPDAIACAHPRDFGGAREFAIELRTGAGLQPFGACLPTRLLDQRLVDQVHLAADDGRLFAATLLDTSVHVFDAIGREMVPIPATGPWYVPPGDRDPSDWPGIDPREAHGLWFRSWTPLNNLVAGSGLLGIQHYIDRGVRHLILFDWRRGERILETDGLMLEAIQGDCLFFSDQRSVVEVFRLHRPSEP
jgi:hypothetical protein